MKHTSGPSDGELHARLNAFVQADAEAETADEDAVREEVQQLTGQLPAKASGEPDRFSWGGRRTADHRLLNGSDQARWVSLWSILERILLVIAGFSVAVSLMTARGTTLTSAIAAGIATVTVLALVYMRTFSRGWMTSQARADLLIRQWEREDARQSVASERQDRLRELAYAREDALRRELWEHRAELWKRELEERHEQRGWELDERFRQRQNELEDRRQQRKYELEDRREQRKYEKKQRERDDQAREEERQDRLRHEQLAVLRALVDRGNLDTVKIDDLVRSLSEPEAEISDDLIGSLSTPEGVPALPPRDGAHAPGDKAEGTKDEPGQRADLRSDLAGNPIQDHGGRSRYTRSAAARPRLLTGQNCTVILTDVVSFAAPWREDEARKIIRRAAPDMIRHALGPAWDTCWCEDRGDGLLIVVPPDIPTAQVIEKLVTVLPPDLKRHNQDHHSASRIQLRVAVTVGPVAEDDVGVAGQAIIQASRMLDARAFRQATASQGADLGLIVSPFVYETHSDAGGSPVDPGGYARVTVRVKETRTSAWMKLIDPAETTALAGVDQRALEPMTKQQSMGS